MWLVSDGISLIIESKIGISASMKDWFNFKNQYVNPTTIYF
ncbi:hypothetical protein BH10BAC3_BH10BAC3_32600 [soil metagenome]